MKQDGIRRGTNHKRLLISQNKEHCCGERGREGVVGLWTLGKVCTMVSAVKCVNLAFTDLTPGANNTLYVNFKKRGYNLYNSNYMTFWKRQNYGGNRKVRDC